MHNPWAGRQWRLVCDWQCHLNRGSAGGDDYAVPVGTPLYAAFSGTLRNRITPSGGGNLYTAILTADHDPQLAFYHLHLSRFVAAGHVAEGDLIGYTGGALRAPGTGTATGPHLHVNAFYGAQIRDVHDFFTTVPAGSESTPITPITPTARITQSKENRMQLVYSSAGDKAVFLDGGTETWVRVPDGAHLPTLAAWIHDMYSKPIQNVNTVGNTDDLVNIVQTRSFAEIQLIGRYKRAFAWRDPEIDMPHDGSTTGLPAAAASPGQAPGTPAVVDLKAMIISFAESLK